MDAGTIYHYKKISNEKSWSPLGKAMELTIVIVSDQSFTIK
jgi:hypothetical protein